MQTQKQKGGTVHEKMGIFVRTFILTLAYLVSGRYSFYLVIKVIASKFPDDKYISGVGESRGR